MFNVAIEIIYIKTFSLFQEPLQFPSKGNSQHRQSYADDIRQKTIQQNENTPPESDDREYKNSRHVFDDVSESLLNSRREESSGKSSGFQVIPKNRKIRKMNS